MAKYQSVNAEWPVGTREGRDLKPTAQEAMSAARRLYRIAMGESFKGKIRLTSGNRATWIRRGIFSVNPDWRDGGWHELVHCISHFARRRLYPDASPHGGQHAFIERELVAAVVAKGWLEGKLRRPEPRPVEPRQQRYKRVLARIAGWETKEKRAKNALRKLERQRKYYERELAACQAGDRNTLRSRK